MFISKLDNVIDLAYWFLYKAAENNCKLSNQKLQFLVFVSQFKYAEKFAMQPLVPAVFVCSDSGIYEPNLQKILYLGRPYMPAPSFSQEINSFLESLWNEFSSYSNERAESFISNLNLFRQNHQKSQKIILDFKSLVESLNKNSKMATTKCDKKKILNSLNGPVVVSQWMPKRVSELTSKNGRNYV